MTQYPIGKSSLSLSAISVALCLFASTGAAHSSEPEGSGGVRFSGFGTLGVVHSEAPEGWGFLRHNDQPSSTHKTRFDTDSQVGIQLNYAASSKIELVGQLLATRREARAPLADAIEWAFAAYRPTADLTLRVGRLNLDQFVLSDYRNVGFAYLYARPPVEFYGSIPSNLDGLDATRVWGFNESRWRAKGFVGRSKINGIPLTGTLGASLSRESDGLLLRAGWMRAKLARNASGLTTLLNGLDTVRALPVRTVATQADDLHRYLDLAAKPLTYVTLGMTYEQGAWQTAAEVARISLGDTNVKAGYASIGRRIGDVSLFGVVSGSTSGRSAVATPAWGTSLAPVIGPAAAQQAQALGAIAANTASRSTRQTTYSLGGRWDIHPRLALKVQLDHVKIRAHGGFLWSNATSDPGSANIATAMLDFVF